MPPMGFEPTISVLERAKTVRALDRAATAIGNYYKSSSTMQSSGQKMKMPCSVTTEVCCMAACVEGLEWRIYMG
jgi:hypothetical protein